MLQHKMVRIRFRKDSPTQPIWAFVGKVIRFSSHWLAVDGKGIMIFRRDTTPPEHRTLKVSSSIVTEPLHEGEWKAGEVDQERRIMIFPREVISNIRVLPDDFDLNDIRIVVQGKRIDLAVTGGPSTSLCEISED